jgi:hypothetical protein
MTTKTRIAKLENTRKPGSGKLSQVVIYQPQDGPGQAPQPAAPVLIYLPDNGRQDDNKNAH